MPAMAKLLIVEDDDKSRKLVRDLLVFNGYQTVEAVNGLDGDASAQDIGRIRRFGSVRRYARGDCLFAATGGDDYALLTVLPAGLELPAADLDPSGHTVIYTGNPATGVRGILAHVVTALGLRPARRGGRRARCGGRCRPRARTGGGH